MGFSVNFFFFSDFSSIFFGLFFFLLESRTDIYIYIYIYYFFFEGVPNFLLRAGRMGEKWVGGRLCNVGGAYLFFLHSLIEKKKFFSKGHGPPSHYVAPPLYVR